MPARRRVSRPAGATAATPVAPAAAEEDVTTLSSLPLNFDVVDEESAAAGAPSPDANVAVRDLFSTVLRWNFDALVARGGAAEVESSEDPRERLQLKNLPLTFKDANVRAISFGLEEKGKDIGGGVGGGRGRDWKIHPPTVLNFFSSLNPNPKPPETTPLNNENRNTSPPSSP